MSSHKNGVRNIKLTMGLWALILMLVGCASAPTVHGIPNFAMVSPGIYRGGQPNEEGFSYLQSLGVDRVIKLNEESEGSDDAAWSHGMVVDYEPVSFAQQIGLKPMPANFVLGFNLGVGRTFIHCEHGQDRTGLFVAMMRMRWQGWTKADSEKEMLEHGFHKVLHGLWKAWEEFNCE